MKASFTKAIRYDVHIVCEDPLCNPGSGRKKNQLLRYRDGTAFLQGVSLVGVLRAWREDNALFGTTEQQGSLTISDIVFDQFQTTSRPHQRICQATGATEGSGFRTTALEKGTTGSFTLIWQGTDAWEPAAADIERYLAALDQGLIRLGAKKRSGYGRVRLDRVCRRAYDMMDPRDREDWLEDLPAVEPVCLKPEPQDWVVFAVRAVMPTVRTKAIQGQTTGQNRYVRAMPLREGGRSVIPGSAIKGVMRGQLERIARSFEAEKRILAMMGSLEHAGKLFITDGHFEGQELERIQKRVTINRISGGISTGALFCEQTTGGTLCWEITLSGGDGADCALLLFALRDLGLGLYTLGDCHANGWGRAESLEVTVTAPTGKAVLKCREGTAKLEDPDHMTQSWIRALRGEML